MGVSLISNSVCWFLLISIAVASGIEHHSSILGIGHAETGTHSAARRSASRVIRQTNQNEAKVCSQIVYKTQCTGNYAQNFINTIGQCSSSGFATAGSAEKLCRQNANGDYCGTIVIDITNIINANQICTSSCSSSCRNALVSLKNSHGCCLSDNPLLQSLSITRYFTSCGISLPSCEETNLNVPSSVNTGASCGSTPAEFLRTTNGFACKRQNLQPTLDALRENNCGTFAQLNELNCGYRNGRYCYETLFTSAGTSALMNALRSCPSSTVCSSFCSSSISDLKQQLGCCVNLYNASLQVYGTVSGGDLSQFRALTSNSLWARCGVSPPGICQVRLTDSAVSLAVTYYSFIFFMLAFSLVAVAV